MKMILLIDKPKSCCECPACDGEMKQCVAKRKNIDVYDAAVRRPN